MIKHRMKKITELIYQKLLRDWLWILAGFALCMLVSWPVLVPGMFRVHDYVHGARIVEIYRGLQAGEFPVRWSQNFGYGYGMPLFHFYAPLPYYFGSLIYWLTANVIWSVKSLFVAINALTIAGGFLLGRKITHSSLGGFVLAVILALTPYRALNMYVRGALSESWAMASIPWLWLALEDLLKSNNKSKAEVGHLFFSPSWFLLVLSSLSILLSHNLTTLMVFPATALLILTRLCAEWLWSYVFLSQKSAESLKTFLLKLSSIGFGFSLAGGLASFYVLPMFFEKDLIRTDIFLSGYFDFNLHFLYIRQFFNPVWGYTGSTWGPGDGISFFLGWPIFTMITVTAGYFVFKLIHFARKKQWSFKRMTLQNFLEELPQQFISSVPLVISLTSVTLLSLFLTLQKSATLWNFLPLINAIQFPWRWLSVATIALGSLAILAIEAFKDSRVKNFLSGLLIVMALAHLPYFRPELWLETPSDLYYDDAVRIQTHMSDIMLDYIPTTLVMDGTGADRKDQDSGLKPFAQLQAAYNPEAFESVTELLNDPAKKLLQVESKESTTLIWPIAHFPGWQTYLNGQPTEATVTEYGLISQAVPAGVHTAGVAFENTPIRTASEILSLLSLLGLFSIAIISQSRHTRN